MEHIPVELDGYNAHRPMVIVHPQAKGLTKRFIRSLADSNITVGALVDCSLQYVNQIEIERLTGLFKWRQCDSIIAVGGEFTMDIAKALAISLSKENDFKQLHIKSRTIPLAYIATQHIDGTEVTNKMNLDGREVASDFFYPDIVCIDNRMVGQAKGLNSTIIAALGALARCVEGVAGDQNSPLGEASAFTAIGLIAKHLPILAQKTANKKAALAVVNGICVAGMVRSNTQGGVACFSAEILARKSNNSANILAGLLLPIALKYKMESGLKIKDDLLLALCGIEKFCTISAEEKTNESIRILESLVSLSSIKLHQLNIQQHLLPKVAIAVEEHIDSRLSMDYCLGFLKYALEEDNSLDK
jgi:alcohol dehydrogenase class IV